MSARQFSVELSIEIEVEAESRKEAIRYAREEVTSCFKDDFDVLHVTDLGELGEEE